MSDTATAGDTGKAAAPASGEGQGSLPLFYSKPEVLTHEAHGTLGLKAKRTYAFAAETNAVPVTVGEFALLARDYPVVFAPHGAAMPLAIVGVRAAQNLFVGKDGTWEPGAYVPAYVRRFPFAFLRDAANERLVLCIDRHDDHVEDGGGQPFFEGAEPSAITKKALEYCTEFQRDYRVTERLAGVLAEHDLLIPQEGNFTIGEEKLTLGPFRVVEQTRLDALSDAAFLELRKTGALPLIYAHLISTANWKPLLQRDKAARA